MVTLRFPAGATPSRTPTPTPTPTATAPAAPSQLTAAAAASRQIRLTWHDNSSNEQGFRIERCRGTGCTDFTEIAVVGPNTTSFLNDGLSGRATYTYRVRGFNNAGTSPYSNTASATTSRF
jgi:Fibronectin type III domain